jgi:hypothetical protein
VLLLLLLLLKMMRLLKQQELVALLLLQLQECLQKSLVRLLPVGLRTLAVIQT